MIFITKHLYWLVLFVPRRMKHKMMWLRKNHETLGWSYALTLYKKIYEA